MKRMKVGRVLLTLWAGLNILAAAMVTILTLATRTSPALLLVLDADAISRIDSRALAVVNAQAALANPCIIGFCVLVLAVVWSNRSSASGSFYRILVPTLAFVQVFAFVSDGYLGHRNLIVNMASTALWTAGLGLVLSAPREVR